MCSTKESRVRSLTLLHKYYDWQIIESLPLTALGELLSFAHKEEERLQKEELEKRLFPLWLVNYAVSIIKPGLEVMEYDEFIKTVLSDEPAPQPKAEQKRTAEDIMAELMPFVLADKQKGG